jgi:lantibiotic biosynthesis protein
MPLALSHFEPNSSSPRPVEKHFEPLMCKTQFEGYAKWCALLHGEAKERAIETIDAIAVLLADPPAVWQPKYSTAEDQAERTHCLAFGMVGVALFFQYLAYFYPSRGYLRICEQFLNKAGENINQMVRSPGLYQGFTGIAWAIAHYCAFRGMDSLDLTSEVDQRISQLLDANTFKDADLMDGLGGIGIYTLETPQKPSAPSWLHQILTQLKEKGETSDLGIAWGSPAPAIKKLFGIESPAPLYNLGMAHGLPGSISILADICQSNLALPDARLLLEKSVQWLLSARLKGEAESVFPSFVVLGVSAPPATLAWCYGDTGIAIALLKASAALGNEELELIALETGLRAAKRFGNHKSGHGLCHGTIGLAHMFNRLYHYTGRTEFKDAAEAYYLETLAGAKEGGEFAGFRAKIIDTDFKEVSVFDIGFLSGISGIGLALLAGLGIDPLWDRLMGLTLTRTSRP